MKTSLIKNEKDSELQVDAYGRLSKKEFVLKLSEIEGLDILNSDIFFGSGPFCTFDFNDERYIVDEDENKYTYSIKSNVYNAESFRILDNYFTELQIPKRKTRPVFWFASIILVGLAIYANMSSS